MRWKDHRRRLAAIGLLAAAAMSAGIATATADPDTGTLPIPDEIGLPAVPGLPQIPGTDNIPDLPGVWTFKLTDEPGSWFDTGIDLFGTKSLGVTTVGAGKVKFVNQRPDTHTNHTASALLWPTGAKNMPFDQTKAWKEGEREVTLKTPGLYAFVCKLHPFMLGAVIVDDPATPGLDLGKTATYLGGRTMPTDSDLYWRIIRAFFVVTATKNWQQFSSSTAGKWDPSYAPAPLLSYTKSGNPKLISNLDVFFQKRFREPIDMPATVKPSTPGVGEVWLDLQYEKTASKTKPGTATAIDTSTWAVTKKFGLPSLNMNNPHNMWTDRGQTRIYQTEWFDDKLDSFDPHSGEVLSSIKVGEAPSHVMTRVDTDQVHVAINGEDHVDEVAPGGASIDRLIPTQHPGEKQTQPHAHGMSADGHIMVTPNSNTDDSTQVDVPSGTITQKPATGKLPIASWVSPDGKTFYTSNFLEGTVSCVSTGAPACHDGAKKVVKQMKVDLMGNYNQDTGAITGPMGGLPIQTPVSPNGKYVMQANTLTATVTIIDTDTNRLVKALPCEAGCHGINYGAKKGGGYYAYVSNKFSNTMDIVDPDPDGDGDPDDAKVAGRVTTDAEGGTKLDDPVSEYSGQGGQGVLPLPLVYNGWVQNLPATVPGVSDLTCEQKHPIDAGAC
jgi:DNA-binding beta-propeller fold protein YncE